MKYNILFVLVLVAILFNACSDNLKVDFIVNGQNLKSIGEAAVDTATMTVFTGDSIIISDVSVPSKSIKSRNWDLDGDGSWDEIFTDKEYLKKVFDTEGVFELKYCVNGEKKCVTKLLKVVAGELNQLDFAPIITFNSPSDYVTDSKSKYVGIEVKTENVFSENELALLVGGKSQSFDFNAETGVLTQKVRLSKGENKIEVQATSSEGMISNYVVVNYGSGGGSKTVSIPPPPPREKQIQTQPKPRQQQTTTASVYNPPVVSTTTNVRPPPRPVAPTPTTPTSTASSSDDDMSNLGAGGLSLSSYKSSCKFDLTNTYSFSITPKRTVELLSFIVYSDECGGIEIALNGEKIKESLVQGKNQVSLIDLGANLKKGKNYTISCKTIAGFGNCEDGNEPKLKDAASCGAIASSKSEFDADYKGKSIIYDLKYLY